jgi:hypothetical protein
MWALWHHNRNLPGAAPILMTSNYWGKTPALACEAPGVPTGFTATGGNRRVDLSWNPGDPSPEGGYNIYYYQGGKYQYITSVGAGTTKYTDNKLQQKTEYCYAITAWNDCEGNITESPYTDIVCASTR